MPVQMPKRNKDGLYQRPAGRQRKGIDWDGVAGRWIPLPGDLNQEFPPSKSDY